MDQVRAKAGHDTRQPTYAGEVIGAVAVDIEDRGVRSVVVFQCPPRVEGAHGNEKVLGVQPGDQPQQAVFDTAQIQVVDDIEDADHSVAEGLSVSRRSLVP